MSLEAITKIRAVEEDMERSKADAKAQAQKLIADADQRLKEAKMAFANYYNPWFKTFFEEYHY